MMNSKILRDFLNPNLSIRPEQIPTQDVQISTQKATYTWEIKNFHRNHMIQANSPDFSPSISNQIKFNLNASFKKSSQKQNFVLLSLCMKNQISYGVDNQFGYLNQELNRGKLSVYYRLAFLDANGQRCLSKDGKAVFANTSRDTTEEPVEGWEYIISYDYLRENCLLTNNGRASAKILCELIIADDSNDTLETTFEQKWQNQTLQPTLVFKNPIPIPSSKSNEALDHYQALLESGNLSDVLLVVGKKEFHVHKAILAARSSVFAAMFSNDLKEKLQNRVVIPDLDVEVCELLLPYIYTGKVPSMKEFALELFFASDKNLIKTLSIQTVAQTYLLADMHSAAYLKRKCVEYITQNSEQVMATKGWVEMTKTRPELLMELYKDISAKANPLLKRTG